MKTCPVCKFENSEISIFCERCDYPFEGTDQEKSIHIGKFIAKKGVAYDKDDSLIKSQRILGLIVFIDIVSLVFTYKYLPDLVLYNNIFMILLFSYCAITIKKHPIVKIIIPMSILILSALLMILISFQAFYIPIVLRGIYISVLGYTIYLVRSHQKFSNKYEK